MKFIDEVELNVISGDGGNGCIGFRREKYVPFGGPDGGDGGRGGHVYIKADDGLNTLMNYRGKKVYQAPNGGKGLGSQCSGKAGKDITMLVPVGTIIKDRDTGEILHDLTDSKEAILLAKGGRGGLGNMNFKSSTNQAPKHATPGEKGQELHLIFELKLLADIALIGLPNAGKSTLISVISAARPKIADYPFTTLEPNLGVCKLGQDSFVVADIPGLIEHASEGKGLGIKFLKHIERTSALIHLVDISWCLDTFEAMDSYIIVRDEMEKYGHNITNKPEIVCLTKIDALADEEVENFVTFFRETLDSEILPVSAVSGKNIEQLKRRMLQLKQASKKMPAQTEEKNS
jgi:GTP-binding protein